MPKIKIHNHTITSFNILSVQVGTNCPQGGDAGHGGRTVFRLFDDAGTVMAAKVNGNAFNDVNSIEIVLGGDSEAETFVEALEFAVKVLRGSIGIRAHDEPEEEVDL